MLIVLLVLVLVFGFGGYRLGGPDNGPYVSIGTILLVLLILYLLGVLGPDHPLRL